MLKLIGIVVWTLLVFAAGLLVGRKNPKVADQAQTLADKVQK